MKSKIRALLRLVCEKPKIFLGLAALAVLGSLFLIPKLQMIDNLDYFHIKDLESTRQYEQLQKNFGDDEYFLILANSSDVFSQSTLETIKNLTKEFEKFPEIRKVRSIFNVEEITGGDGTFEVDKLLNKTSLSVEEVEKLKLKISTNPLYKNVVVNENLDSLAMIIWPKNNPDLHTFRNDLLEKVDAALGNEKLKNSEIVFTKAGWTVTNVALSSYSKKDLTTFIPICFVLMIVFVTVAFRNINYTFIAALNMAASLSVVLAAFPILGFSVTNLSAAAIPVILSLTIADTVHLFNYLKSSSKEDDLKVRIYNMLDQAIWPCMLTSATTCIGFLSSCFNELKPLAEFGIISAIGMIVEFLFSFTLIPCIILISKRPEKYFQSDTPLDDKPSFLGTLSGSVPIHSRKIIIFFSFMSLIFIYLLPRLDVNTSLVDYLDSSLPERKAVAFIEEKFGGIQTFDIVLSSKVSGNFKKPEQLGVVEQVIKQTETHSEISKVIGFPTFVKEMNKAFHSADENFYKLPESEEQVSQYLLMYDSNETQELVLPDYTSVRLLVRTTLKKSSDEREFLKALERELRPIIPADVDLVITGRMVDQVAVSDSIVDGQIESLASALIFVGLVMMISLHSITLGLISLIPNVIPILGNFAFMVISGIPLDTGTSLIASIVLGVAVDDTIHFLLNFKQELKKGRTLEESVRIVMQFKGFAISITSFVLSAGFGVLCFGNFVPIQNFGYLTAFVMLFAPLADLFLLPAILIAFPKLSVTLRD